MISRHYGFTTSISKIREVAGTDLAGTNIKGLMEAGEKLGFEVKAVKSNKTRRFKRNSITFNCSCCSQWWFVTLCSNS